METVKELINISVDALRKNSVSTAIYSRPFYPTCIVYFGARSALFHPEMQGDITRGWGGNADYIKFYTVDSPDSDCYRSAITGEVLDAHSIGADITEMMSSQTVFCDMNFIALYCILDTSDINDPTEFEKWYLKIEEIKKTFKVSTLSMLTVVLNQSIDRTEISREITRKLLALYQSPEIGQANCHLYNSVFIVGNRMKNGGFFKLDPNDRDYADFNLLANLVILSNTKDDDYSTRRGMFYNPERPALAAAYGVVKKPMAQIAMISLSVLIEKLNGKIKTEKLDSDSLTAALKIERGSSQTNNQSYVSIKPSLPANDFVKWLPLGADNAKQYDEANKLSFGCLDRFVEENYLRTVDSALEEQRDDLKAEILSLLSESVNAAQLANGVSEMTKKEALDRAEAPLRSNDKVFMFDTIDSKVKQEIAVGVRKITLEAINKAQELADKSINNFKEITSELSKMIAVGVIDEGLKTFYANKVQIFFSDDKKVKDILNRTLKITNKKSDMLNVLFTELQSLFQNDPVYKLSFVDELKERLDARSDSQDAMELIGTELINNLGEKIYYHSQNVFRTQISEAYMLDTGVNNSNMLYQNMNARPLGTGITRTFFNTCNSDMAESMWFYDCSTDNLNL